MFFRRFGNRVHGQATAAALQRNLQSLEHTGAFGAGKAEAVGHHIEQFALAADALAVDAGESAGAQPLGEFFGAGGCWQLHGEGDHHARVVRSLGAAQQLRVDRVGRVVLHRQGSGAVE